MSAAGESGLRIVISQHVRERQRIAALDAEVDALQRQAVALGAVTPRRSAVVLLGVKIAAAASAL